MHRHHCKNKKINKMLKAVQIFYSQQTFLMFIFVKVKTACNYCCSPKHNRIEQLSSSIWVNRFLLNIYKWVCMKHAWLFHEFPLNCSLTGKTMSQWLGLTQEEARKVQRHSEVYRSVSQVSRGTTCFHTMTEQSNKLKWGSQWVCSASSC